MKLSPFVTTVAGFLAGVGTTQALTLSKRAFAGVSISSQCQNALLGVASNSDAATCLNTKVLIPGILTLQPNTSAVPFVNTFLQGICSADPCSNATLTAIASNITTGCGSDLDSAGISLGTVLKNLPQEYSTIREIVCLKSTSNDTLCASNLLLGFQDVEGSLSLTSATNIVAEVTGQASNGSLPTNLLCTDCSRAAFNVLIKNDPSVGTNSQFQSAISSQCGSGFLSAPSPTEVVEGTGTAAPTGTLPAHLVSNNGNSSNGNTNSATAILAGAFTSTSIALFAGLYTLVA